MIIGTLAAAALALLIIVPVWAGPGVDQVRTAADGNLTATVYIGDAGGGATAQSRLGSTVYVSNNEAAHHIVGVEVSGAGVGTDEVTVTSDSGTKLTMSTGNGFKVVPPQSAGDVESDCATVGSITADDGCEIEALHGDTITIRAGGKTLRLTVDADKPVISSVSPANRTLQSSDSVNIGFVVTDDDSGLRRDNESGGDGSRDNDGQDAEPLSDGTIGASADINVIWQDDGDDTNNASNVDGEDHNLESRGDRAWTELERDHSYQGALTIGDLDAGTYKWRIEATDRAGNKRVTDSSSSKGNQDFSVEVDDESPVVNRIFAGIGFDSAKNREKADPSSILVVFVNEDRPTELDALDTSTVDPGDFTVEDNTVVDVIHPNEKLTVDSEDLVKGADLTVAKGSPLIGKMETPEAATESDDQFTIQRLDEQDPPELQYEGTGSPVEIQEGDVLSNLTSALAKVDDTCDSDTGNDPGSGTKAFTAPLDHPEGCIDTRNRLYLVLETPLDNDETPEVQALGGSVRDKAGNANETVEMDAADKIAPTLTIDVSGDVETDGRPLAREEITVKIATGERLGAAPSVWLVTFDHTGKITNVDPETGSADGTNAWEASFEGTDDETQVAAIIVQGRDRHQNVSTSKGWSNKGGEAGPDIETLNLADLDDAGLLVEFDDDIPDADVTVNPDASENGQLKTESVNPFIQLAFDEGKENTVEVGDVEKAVEANEDEDIEASPAVPAKAQNSHTDDDGVETKFDSYGRVELSNVTLDGEDVTDQVERLSSAKFDLALYGLSVGDHVLEFTATDTAGNAITDEEVKFEVLPRSAYEIDLRPGWNLVSFPGEPVDTEIDSVLPADSPAIEVLTYEAGLWIASVREAGQPWEGELTDIDGRHAYWINATRTGTLEAVLIEPGTAEASRPPAIQLIVGWNLIPVTDLDQGPAGDTSHDDYFTSMIEEDFVRGYVFNAQTRRWERLGYTSEVSNGQGVWVYSRSNVVLVP